MAQDFELHMKESKYPNYPDCKNTLPHCHCKCPYCGNPDCVCEFANPKGR